jgi:hypothetical protein
MTLFGVKVLMENDMVLQVIKTFFSDSLCPLIAKNSTVCYGGVDLLGG